MPTVTSLSSGTVEGFSALPSILQCELQGLELVTRAALATGGSEQGSRQRLSWGRGHCCLTQKQGCVAGAGRGEARWAAETMCCKLIAHRQLVRCLGLHGCKHPSRSPHTLAYDGVDLCTTWSYKFFISFV